MKLGYNDLEDMGFIQNMRTSVFEKLKVFITWYTELHRDSSVEILQSGKN